MSRVVLDGCDGGSKRISRTKESIVSREFLGPREDGVSETYTTRDMGFTGRWSVDESKEDVEEVRTEFRMDSPLQGLWYHNL